MITFSESDGTIHSYGDDTLLIFIDDTGHEELKDKSFPVFGFGGCIFLVSEYPKIISLWKDLTDCFPKENQPLHASSLNPLKLTETQKKRLIEFFTKNNFARFAAISSNKTELLTKHSLFEVMASITHSKIEDVITNYDFNRIVMVFERSERTLSKIPSYFSKYRFEKNGQIIPVDRFYSSKKNNETGLIISDFIAHTAGASVMSKLKGKISRSMERKDFEAVFASISQKYVGYIEIGSVGTLSGK